MAFQSQQFLDFGSLEAQHSPAVLIYGPLPFQCHVQTSLQLHGVRVWWHPLQALLGAVPPPAGREGEAGPEG